MLVFGFIFLAIVTAWGFLKEWVLHYESPYTLISARPMKLLAILGPALLLTGIYLSYKERQANAEKAGYGSYFDWQLIYLIAAVGATGFLSWPFRLVGIGHPGLPHLLPAPGDGLLPVLLRPLHQDGPHGVPHHGHALCPHGGPGLLTPNHIA